MKWLLRVSHLAPNAKMQAGILTVPRQWSTKYVSGSSGLRVLAECFFDLLNGTTKLLS